jgi:hypothetical protein
VRWNVAQSLTAAQQDMARTNIGLGAGVQNRVVDTIAALKALDKTKFTRAFVTGYYAAGDGGGGAYYYDAADTTSSDNGGTIIVAIDGGRWKLIWHTFLSVKQFGAKGDGATNDTTAIQAAATAAAGRILFFPKGTYITTDKITLSSGTTVCGEGWLSIIKSNTLADGGSGIRHRQFHCDGITDFAIRDIALDSSGMTVWQGGMRSIYLNNCSRYTIERVKFTTNGAATASVGCSNFWIQNNDVTISATDSAAHHDGIIDQWGGCSHFKVLNNRVNGAGYGRWPILVTGESTAGAATPNYDFEIAGNDIYNCAYSGIWLNGREGTNYDFSVHDNDVDTVATYYGIAASDCREGVINANTTKGTARCGIVVFEETAQGGALSGVNIVVSDNTIRNANTSNQATDAEGSAISVLNNSSGVIVSINRVAGTGHRYGVHFAAGTSNCRETGNIIDAGTQGKVSSSSATSIPSNGSYTPTLTGVANVASSLAYQCGYSVIGDLVTVTLKISITPTAGATTATQVGISLPFASNLASADTDLQGCANSSFGVQAAIYADTINDRAQLQFPAPNTSVHVLYGQFTYRLL